VDVKIDTYETVMDETSIRNCTVRATATAN
jgi:hypothetical protein